MISTVITISAFNSRSTNQKRRKRRLPRAKTPLQLAIIRSLSTSEIHSPNNASTVPALLPSAIAGKEEAGAEEEGKSV